MNLSVLELIAGYRAGALRPTEVIDEVYERIARSGERPIWISLFSREAALTRARGLENDSRALALPLYGVPFAVKDNIDAVGLPTTAGCPEFAFIPKQNATAVQRLLDAGAILVGKTNMDQFATGLVGVRSPYGACSSVFDSKYISGGSSSGSAVAVASNLVSFSLGTDTAGSGRVPAAFNGIVGLKPTRGWVSAAGVVPACRSLDCISIFAKDVADVEAVFHVARGYDSRDSFSRIPESGAGASPWLTAPAFRFGVPSELEFFGDDEAAKLFHQAIEKLKTQGGEPVSVDYTPFRKTAELLYAGPWVAERYAAIRTFFEAHAEAVHPVVRGIIDGATRYSAADAFSGLYKLQELRAQTEAQWDLMDVLLLPTTPTIYTHEQIAAEPVLLNSRLGYYTNFVNLLDLAAVAIPAGLRPNGLPFGVTLVGPAFSEAALLRVAGNTRAGTPAPGCIEVAVVGAHLTGQPLNRELTARGARIVRTTKTAPGYRLFALRDTVPPKPGLVREDGLAGPGIEVEVWSVPENEFGSFVAGVPAPLGIGNALLADGSTVKCFICEGYSVAGSREITHFGGWRAFRASL